MCFNDYCNYRKQKKILYEIKMIFLEMRMKIIIHIKLIKR